MMLVLCGLVALTAFPHILSAQSGKPKRNAPREQRQDRQSQAAVFYTDVPSHEYDIILGRPTDTVITSSVLFYQTREGYVEYGLMPGTYDSRTETQSFAQGEPVEIVLAGLQRNARYYYRLRYRASGATEFLAGEEATFQTQRLPGSAFTFTIQADPHLDENTSTAVYTQTLRNALADQPDFHIDLGDTFMTDKYRNNYRDAFKQYLAQRYYFGLICHASPLFLVLGNHDGEAGSRLNGTADNMTVWSNAMRKRYYPNPFPDGFYTGNATEEAFVGLPENYYAWKWGNALFIVLDPYWPTTARGLANADDPWSRTLGDAQYHWLTQTLEQSRARFKFVFIHYLLGGRDQASRGGVAIAKNFEWGGIGLSGTDEFSEKRPGWVLPIHQLLVKHHVSAVFHGHDHLFAKEELDGIVYQLVPQPGQPRDDNTRSAAEYGYTHGDVLGSSGHLRVTVSASETRVEYVRAYLPQNETEERKNGDVAYSYSMPAMD